MSGRDAWPVPPHDDGLVLVVNAGSSSLKFGLYPRRGPALLQGEVDGLEPQARAGGATTPEDRWPALLSLLAARVEAMLAGRPLQAVAHRIVHGGGRFVRPQRLDAEALAWLDTLSPLAPLHQPHNLAGVRACAAHWPQLPQVGCFDTAFHATLPPVETRLPLPAALAANGLRRYGFHGLSYRHASRALRAHSPRAHDRVLLAHLGGGASLCATVDGRSVATTMGFSALDGLMMGTRCGSIDPGVVLHLWRQGWTLAAVERLLHEDSGLRGVSGLSGDMRALRQSDAPAAQDAIALFTHRIVREAGALVAVLGGLDLLAFTGGIGEHDAALRADVADALSWLGLRLDEAANHAAVGTALAPVPIHAPDSAVEAWVVPADEGRVAADDAFTLLDAPASVLDFHGGEDPWS